MNKGGSDGSFFLVTYAHCFFYFLELVNQTLHVRIAGVDAPEVALFSEHVHSI